jgi:aminocarboxymuconate-semialdehyde decarboxylase
VIDVHNHAVPPRAIDFLRSEPGFGITIEGSSWSGGKHAHFELVPSFVDPDAKLAELDANALDEAIVSVAPPLFCYRSDPDAGRRLCEVSNEGLAEFCDADRSRLRWLAHVPMQAPELAADVLAQALSEDGCCGVEIGSTINGRRLDEPEFELFWERAAALGAPVLIHPDIHEPLATLAPYYLSNVIGFPLETTITIDRLICAGVLARNPNLRIVLVHAGGYFPYQAGRLKHARTVRPELSDSPENPWDALSQLWFDHITHDREALAFLVERVGVENVVLGTDLPFDMALPDPVAKLNEAVGRETARQIGETNAARLFAS